MKTIQIYFGTQTFTSEFYANAFKEDSILKYGLEIECGNIRDYSSNWKSIVDGENILILFLSTYGDGEPTSDAVEFFNFLKNSKQLPKVQFAIFGLGNSRYRKYQGFSKEIDLILGNKSANRLFETGFGDGDFTEDNFEEWKDEFLEFLEHKFSLKKKDFDDTPVPKYKIKWFSKRKKAPLPFLKFKLIPNSFRPFLGKCVKKEEQLNVCEIEDCSTDLRRICQIDFDIRKSRIMFTPGDHMNVYPENSDELIDEYFKILKVPDDDKDKLLTLIPENPLVSGYTKNVFPQKTTLRNVFKYYLDLTKVPSKKALKFLAEFAKDEKEKKELKFLTSFDGKDKFMYEIGIMKLRMLEVLRKYTSVSIPLNVFFEITHRLKPRVYSIASCYETSPDVVTLLVARTHYKSKYDGKIGFGVCSKYLNDLKVGDMCYIYPEISNFYLPEDTTIPVIMVSVGCALATFRGFLEYRKRLLLHHKKKMGECVLYYGCRNKKIDWLYEKEQLEYKNLKILSRIFTAFSRDQKKKVYVQHVIQKNEKEVLRMMKSGARIYVCGTIDMAKNVYDVFVKILINGKVVKDENEAEKFLENVYLQEVTDN